MRIRLLLRLAVLVRLLAAELAGRAQVAARPRRSALTEVGAAPLELSSRRHPTEVAVADTGATSRAGQLGAEPAHQSWQVVEKQDRHGRTLERFCGACGLLLEEKSGRRGPALSTAAALPVPEDLVHVPEESALSRVWFAPSITLASLPLVASFDLASATGLLIAGILVTTGALVYFRSHPRAAARLVALHGAEHPGGTPLERLSSLFHPWRR